jgi:hypothetical protein
MDTPMRIRYYLDGSIIQTETPLYDDCKEEIASGIWRACARKAPGEVAFAQEPTPEEIQFFKDHPAQETAPAKGPTKAELATPRRVRHAGTGG